MPADPGRANPAAKQKAHGYVIEINAMTRQNAGLSAVVKWCLLFRNVPQLARLAA